MNKNKIAIILGVMCLILTVAIIVQYKTVKDASKLTGFTTNSELKTEVLKWKEKYEETEDRKRLEGNIYLGKVENVLLGMQAAFVDIGEEKNTDKEGEER